jgi:hypothetical protein
MPEVESRAATAAAAAPKAIKSRARARFNQAMRIVRRIHLYTGLFMTPWVFLYGISGMLFNHPDRFADQEVTYFGAAETAGGPLERGLPPGALAGRVVAALNSNRTESRDDGSYRLVRPGEAAFSRDLFALVRSEGQNHSARVDLDHGVGSVRKVEPAEAVAKQIGPKGGLKLDPPPFEPVTRALPDVLRKLGLPAESAIVRNGPDLSFLMEGEGKTWRVTYNTTTGSVLAKPEDAAGPLSVRRFLILLHVAHEFPSRVNARWVWAIAVDLMFVSMVGWGFTGLLMWWQMKNVRRIGIIVLLASAATATAMAIGMHRILTT